MNEQELVHYIKQRIIVLLAIAAAVGILLLFKSARAENGLWSPPMGMVFKSGGQCFKPTESYVAMRTCDWGPAGNEVISGTAYFRVCKRVMETQPFLIADYERNLLIYIINDHEEIQGPEDANLREFDHDYMFSFLDDYESRFGICDSR